GSSPIRRFTEGWTDDFLLQTTENAVKYAVSLGLDVMYVTEDTTRCDPALVRFIMEEVVKPSGEKIRVDWHGHCDRGLAIANSMAALVAGAECIHACA